MGDAVDPAGPIGEVVYLRHAFRPGSRGGLRFSDALFAACPHPRKVQVDVPSDALEFLRAHLRLLRTQPRRDGRLRLWLLGSLADVPWAVLHKARDPSLRVVAPLYHLFPWAEPGARRHGKLGLRVVHRLCALLEVRFLDLLFTQSPWMREWVLSRRPGLPVVVGAPGVSRERWQADAATVSMPREPQVLFLAALNRAKGLDEVLEAWPRIAERVPQAHLTLVGFATSGEVDRLRARLGRAGSTVQLVPNASEEQKVALLARSRVLLGASMAEGVPFAFLEAMSSGARVVAYDLPTLVPLRGHFTGVPLGDREALVQAVVRVLQAPAADRLGSAEAAHRFCGDSLWEDVIRDMAGQICETVGSWGPIVGSASG